MILEQLVKKVQKGNKDAFVELIELNKLSLARAGKAILSDDEDVADAVSETVLTAFLKIKNIKKPKYFKTWLTRVLIYNCYDILRKRRRTIQAEGLSEESYQEDRDTAIDVHNALELMSENDKLILTLFYLDDLSIKDIASILNCKEGTIKARLSRGRKRFSSLYNVTEKKEANEHEAL